MSTRPHQSPGRFGRCMRSRYLMSSVSPPAHSLRRWPTPLHCHDHAILPRRAYFGAVPSPKRVLVPSRVVEKLSRLVEAWSHSQQAQGGLCHTHRWRRFGRAYHMLSATRPASYSPTAILRTFIPGSIPPMPSHALFSTRKCLGYPFIPFTVSSRYLCLGIVVVEGHIDRSIAIG